MLESAVTSLMLSRVYRNQSYNREVKTKVWRQTCRVQGSDRTAAVLTFVGFAHHTMRLKLKQFDHVFKTSQQATSGDVVKVEVAI